MNHIVAKSGVAKQRFLIVMVSGRPYGIDVNDVVEVAMKPEVTPLPQAPDHIVGVFSHRGYIIALSDLRTRFGCRTVRESDGCVIIVNISDPHATDPFQVGVLVDEVRDIVELRDDVIQQPPSLGSIMPMSFILGIARAEEGAMLLLNISETLMLDEIEPVDSFSDELDAFLTALDNEVRDPVEQPA